VLRTPTIAGSRGRAPTSDGPDGNEELTARTGVVLLVLLAVLGVTIVRIGSLVWLHLFLGLLLIGPVALKMASTGYRFVRYYSGDPSYRRKGPPPMALRLLAPGVILSTVAVFATGVVLLFLGPSSRGTWLTLHKASFFVWLAATGLHVLGHVPGLPAALTASRGVRAELPGLEGVPGLEGGGRSGGSVRMLGLFAALAIGAVLALVLIPEFGAWTAFRHGHHG
jgi:hypothetical protein